MIRLSVILVLLALAACTPNRQQNAVIHALPPGLVGDISPAPIGASSAFERARARRPEIQRLESVGERILSAAALVCGALNPDSASAQPGRTQAAECNYPLVISNKNEINAFTDGRRVRVTRRLVRFAARDAELAFTIAHEVAHNLLGHRSRSLFGNTRQLEFDADKIGLQLVAKAGYDPHAGVQFLRRLAASDPRRDRPQQGYPSFSSRADVLQDLAEGILSQISSDPGQGFKISLTTADRGL